jgi:molybdopterin synthase catalytic subunit
LTTEMPTVPDQHDWDACGTGELPVDQTWRWASLDGCGAVVTFCGTVRNHSDQRSDVVSLEYEAYEEYVVPRLLRIAAQARQHWPEIGRLVLLHRVGILKVGEVSVVVTASTPHRAHAFSAAHFCIDTIKLTVPIWKRETWVGGSEWTVCAHESDGPESHFGATPRSDLVANDPA